MEESIFSKPTRADAELFVKLYGIAVNSETLVKALRWWTEEFDEMSYEEFKEKYPRGTDGWINFRTLAMFYEVMGVLVYHGLLSEDLVYDVFSTRWRKAGPIVKGMQRDRNSLNYSRITSGMLQKDVNGIRNIHLNSLKKSKKRQYSANCLLFFL